MTKDDDALLPREPLCFEGGKPVDAYSLVGYLSLLAEGKDPYPEQLMRQLGKAMQSHNMARGLDLLSQGMGHNEGARAQRLLNRLIGFAQGTYPSPQYTMFDFRHDFERTTGIPVDSPAKSRYFYDLVDNFSLLYHAGEIQGLDR